MPVKSSGEISEIFSTAKKDTDKMLSTCQNKKLNQSENRAKWLNVIFFVVTNQRFRFFLREKLNCAYNCVRPWKPVKRIYRVSKSVSFAVWFESLGLTRCGINSKSRLMFRIQQKWRFLTIIKPNKIVPKLRFCDNFTRITTQNSDFCTIRVPNQQKLN